MNLKGRDFLKLLDYSPEEIKYLLDLAHYFKLKKQKGVKHEYLKGKNIVLLFEKTSTRTRCAFEVAGHDLGMGVTFLDPVSSQMGKKESIEDTAKVLCRMYDGIEYRGFEQSIVEKLANSSSVPVWNGLTNEFHPTQMLADLMTIEEHFKKLKGLNLVFMGDGRNNVANSLMVACAKMEINFTCCSPKKLWSEKELVDKCRLIANENNCTITLTDNVKLGTLNQDIVYTDVWVSMGEPSEVWEERINLLKKYQVNKKVIENMKPNCILLHCLPSFHDLNTSIGKEIYEKFGLTEMEVSDEVLKSNVSKVFEEAENRMHTIKAVIYATLGDYNE